MTLIAELRPFSLCFSVSPRIIVQFANFKLSPVSCNFGGLNVVAGDGRLCSEVQGRGRARVRREAWRWDDEEIVADSQATFAEGVTLFNAGEYYECHDILEGLWNNAPEPQRSVLHGILQCAVGLYHLLNQVLGFGFLNSRVWMFFLKGEVELRGERDFVQNLLTACD